MRNLLLASLLLASGPAIAGDRCMITGYIAAHGLALDVLEKAPDPERAARSDPFVCAPLPYLTQMMLERHPEMVNVATPQCSGVAYVVDQPAEAWGRAAGALLVTTEAMFATGPMRVQAWVRSRDAKCQPSSGNSPGHRRDDMVHR